MAQNGGARLPQSSAPAVGITLSQPRPDGLRNGNYYTETPLRPAKNEKWEKTTRKLDTGRCASTTAAAAAVAPVHRSRVSPAPLLPRSRVGPCGSVSVTFTKSKSKGTETETTETNSSDSIVCVSCGKCKCLACREPRALPSKWICNSRYECSAEALVDTVSCMCCVKGVFYHCTKDGDMDDDVSCADRPCSCSDDRRCVRWSCMGALSLFMPCLLCYWPLKGCLKGLETCYARYHTRG
uniref:Protein sprouty n=1 Tax=Strigamia maritima TaxID=126957 RepID=T1JJ50_STRMM